MKNHDFHFDKERSILTISKADCGALMATAPSGEDRHINWNPEEERGAKRSRIKAWIMSSEITCN